MRARAVQVLPHAHKNMTSPLVALRDGPSWVQVHVCFYADPFIWMDGGLPYGWMEAGGGLPPPAICSTTEFTMGTASWPAMLLLAVALLRPCHAQAQITSWSFDTFLSTNVVPPISTISTRTGYFVELLDENTGDLQVEIVATGYGRTPCPFMLALLQIRQPDRHGPPPCLAPAASFMTTQSWVLPLLRKEESCPRTPPHRFMHSA